MRLLTYWRDDETRTGALLDDGWILDLADASRMYTPGATSSSRPLPVDMRALLELAADSFDFVRSAIETAATVDAADRRGPSWSLLSDTRLAPPVPKPGKLICVGLNYYDHCREAGYDVPDHPVIFAKFPSSMTGHGSQVAWNSKATEEVDYEAEFAFVMGRRCRNVSAEDAMSYVAGYTIVNDVSARDIQKRDGQWTLAKSFDTFTPVGPVLVSADEVDDPHALGIRCVLNGETVQDSSTSQLIFGIPQLVAYISAVATLEPGDIVATGTPGGVGAGRTPPRFLADGDSVEVSIERLGTLQNQMRVTAQ